MTSSQFPVAICPSGVMTAEEITQLDLGGCELVVLSALGGLFPTWDWETGNWPSEEAMSGPLSGEEPLADLAILA